VGLWMRGEDGVGDLWSMRLPRPLMAVPAWLDPAGRLGEVRGARRMQLHRSVLDPAFVRTPFPAAGPAQGRARERPSASGRRGSGGGSLRSEPPAGVEGRASRRPRLRGAVRGSAGGGDERAALGARPQLSAEPWGQPRRAERDRSPASEDKLPEPDPAASRPSRGSNRLITAMRLQPPDTFPGGPSLKRGAPPDEDRGIPSRPPREGPRRGTRASGPPTCGHHR